VRAASFRVSFERSLPYRVKHGVSEREDVGATMRTISLLFVLGVAFGCASSDPCESPRIARLCSEATPRIPAEGELDALSPEMQCKVTLLLGRGTQGDRTLAECLTHGGAWSSCGSQHETGIMVQDEAFCPCAWSPPEGWDDCKSNTAGN
jgi:hypothetical protein